MIYKNRNKGGSFIQFIFIVAFLAVVVYVCGPILLDKIDANRAASDDVQVTELVQFMKKAINKKYYLTTELSKYAAHGNVSCYIDKESESKAKGVTVTQAAVDYKEQRLFKDNNREKIGKQFYAAGNMYGMTLTFELKDNKINFGDVIVNKYIEKGQDGVNLDTKLVAKDRDADLKKYRQAVPNYKKNGTLKTMSVSGSSVSKYFYDLFVKQFQDPIEIKSNKYKDSEFTIFVSFNINENNEIAPKDVTMYGQWNGYYLGQNIEEQPTEKTKRIKND